MASVRKAHTILRSPLEAVKGARLAPLRREPGQRHSNDQLQEEEGAQLRQLRQQQGHVGGRRELVLAWDRSLQVATAQRGQTKRSWVTFETAGGCSRGPCPSSWGQQ